MAITPNDKNKPLPWYFLSGPKNEEKKIPLKINCLPPRELEHFEIDCKTTVKTSVQVAQWFGKVKCETYNSFVDLDCPGFQTITSEI